MNKEWASLCKEFQNLIKNKDTFELGKAKLLELRRSIYDTVLQARSELDDSDFFKQPFLNKEGYESKTMAYSLYHILRIEDICLSYLMKDEEEIFTRENYQARMNSSIITTGNELKGREIEEFSKHLNIDELYHYFTDVYTISNEYINNLKFEDLKNKISEEKKNILFEAGCVSHNEDAVWLIDYWCSKNILGLLKMPFSRHWIMHIEAFLRIMNKI